MSTYEKVSFTKPLSLILLMIVIWGLIHRGKGKPRKNIIRSVLMKVENVSMPLPFLTRLLKIFLYLFSAKLICNCIHVGVLDICGQR